MVSLLPRIGLFYAAGVVAAAQLGKMTALGPAIGAEIVLGLVLAAALVSLLEIGGALFGRGAGAMAQRLGQGRALPMGMALLAVAGLGGALASTATELVLWRLVEAAGYLAVIVSAPVLVALAVTPQERGAALALWSTFVPVGLMLGAALSGWIAEGVGWRWAMLLWGAASGALWLALRRRSMDIGEPTPPGETRPAGIAVWLLTLGFGFFALFQVGLLALLPAFLTERAGASLAAAGVVTGASSFLTVLGIGFAARWMRRPRPLASFAIAGLALPAAMLFGVFVAEPEFWTVSALSIVLNAVSGAFCGLCFALLPAMAGPGRLSTANGLIAQFGASGSLIGPPLYAACVDGFGWRAAAVCGAVACALALCFFMAAIRDRGAVLGEEARP